MHRVQPQELSDRLTPLICTPSPLFSETTCGMTSNNRGDRIQLLQKVLKKHFKPVPATDGRTVLEQLLFASCLEDARYDAAEEAFQRMQELYFDWNEMRVTTVTELADALRNLPNPTAA